ncbi:hypothetical protein C8J57DRAFT_1293551 [Mycena rebaudengoi]|nr:hypothetical protein C8J57DRAFT_1293551 [Mycena rebaudengoi]
MSEVTYIYKLVPLSVPIPDPLPEALPLSNLDSTDGFIHLSTAVQVPKTLKRFFADESKITVLRIKYATVEKDIKWESPDGKGPGEKEAEGVFPHLYNGGRLGSGEIESVFVFENAGDWEEAARKAASWLIY